MEHEPAKPMSALPVAIDADRVVVVIDDDPAVRASLRFALEIDGFAVQVFATSDELLARETLPAGACLVVDYLLPTMNGLELIAALRRRGVSAPAILITSDPPARLRREAAAVGLTLIEKPLLGNGLADAICSALAGRRPSPHAA
jgi:two-component system response regulator FixJ